MSCDVVMVLGSEGSSEAARWEREHNNKGRFRRTQRTEKVEGKGGKEGAFEQGEGRSDDGEKELKERRREGGQEQREWASWVTRERGSGAEEAERGSKGPGRKIAEGGNFRDKVRAERGKK